MRRADFARSFSLEPDPPLQPPPSISLIGVSSHGRRFLFAAAADRSRLLHPHASSQASPPFRLAHDPQFDLPPAATGAYDRQLPASAFRLVPFTKGHGRVRLPRCLYYCCAFRLPQVPQKGPTFRALAPPAPAPRRWQDRRVPANSRRASSARSVGAQRPQALHPIPEFAASEGGACFPRHDLAVFRRCLRRTRIGLPSDARANKNLGHPTTKPPIGVGTFLMIPRSRCAFL